MELLSTITCILVVGALVVPGGFWPFVIAGFLLYWIVGAWLSVQ
jgi:hypothetical protein